MQAVRQLVFTDVLIVGRLDVDGQSFAPIGVDIKRHSNGMKGLPEVQIQN